MQRKKEEEDKKAEELRKKKEEERIKKKEEDQLRMQEKFQKERELKEKERKKKEEKEKLRREQETKEKLEKQKRLEEEKAAKQVQQQAQQQAQSQQVTQPQQQANPEVKKKKKKNKKKNVEEGAETTEDKSAESKKAIQAKSTPLSAASPPFISALRSSPSKPLQVQQSPTVSIPTPQSPPNHHVQRSSNPVEDDDADIANLLQNLVPPSFDESHAHETFDESSGAQNPSTTSSAANASPVTTPVSGTNTSVVPPQPNRVPHNPAPMNPWPSNAVPQKLSTWAPKPNTTTGFYPTVVPVNGYAPPVVPLPGVWANPAEDVNMKPNGYVVYPSSNFVNTPQYIRPPNQNLWIRQQPVPAPYGPNGTNPWYPNVPYQQSPPPVALPYTTVSMPPKDTVVFKK